MKKWIIKKRVSQDIIEQLLANRGIKDCGALLEYLAKGTLPGIEVLK